MYLVTRHFTTGPLKGLTITEETRVAFVVGRTYKPCAGASAYRVEACWAVAAEPPRRPAVWPFPPLCAKERDRLAAQARREQRAAVICGPEALL